MGGFLNEDRGESSPPRKGIQQDKTCVPELWVKKKNKKASPLKYRYPELSLEQNNPESSKLKN